MNPPLSVGVLALQGDVCEHRQALEAAGASVVGVRQESELTHVDALVLPGGESTVLDKLLQTFGLFETLRKHIAAGLPVLGTCAGMILLADRITDAAPGQQTLGGIDMTVRRNAFGRQVDSCETTLTWAGEQAIPTVFIRAPWVEQVGESVEVLATLQHDDSPPHIVAVRSGNLLATSFHPELTADLTVHRYFLELVVKALPKRSVTVRQEGQ